MKTIQTKTLRFYNRLIMLLLIFLGFAACDDEDEMMPVEYGTPHATYKLKGKVVDQEELPVQDIRIIVNEDEKFWRKDTLYTDRKGEFLYENSFVWPGSKLNVVYKDVRDQEVYKTDSVLVDMGKLTGGGTGWYNGEAYKEITIKLEEKKDGE